MVGANPIIYEHLKTKFPHFIIPKEEYSMELHISTFSFKNKDDIFLFYKLWDSITKIIYEFDIRHFFPMHAYSYNNVDDVVGFIFRIFEINFDYKIDHWVKYWNSDLGLHRTTMHDNWYYKYNRKMISEEQIHYSWTNFGKFIIPVNPTQETYISRNKELIDIYFNHHLSHCKWEISDDNQVFIKFLL